MRLTAAQKEIILECTNQVPTLQVSQTPGAGALQGRSCLLYHQRTGAGSLCVRAPVRVDSGSKMLHALEVAYRWQNSDLEDEDEVLDLMAEAIREAGGQVYEEEQMKPKPKVHLVLGALVAPVCGHRHAGLLSRNELQVTCKACLRIWEGRTRSGWQPN